MDFTYFIWRSILTLVVIENSLVLGYYCKWDQCGSDQYCCGDNLCCDYVYSLWYFWIAIIFIILLLSACGGIFRYCFYSTPQINYTPVPVLIPTDENNDKTHKVRDIEAPPVYSPYDQYNTGRYQPPNCPSA